MCMYTYTYYVCAHMMYMCIHIYIPTHIYTYIKLNHFAIHQKLTQHYKPTVLQ